MPTITHASSLFYLLFSCFRVLTSFVLCESVRVCVWSCNALVSRAREANESIVCFVLPAIFFVSSESIELVMMRAQHVTRE